jgi:hypothetical protein
MKGALVFLVVFAIGVAVSLASPGIPPGSQIYSAVGGVDIDYPILGIPVATLVPACFNGIIYGIIAWIIYSAVFGRGKDQQQIQQRVEIHQNVQVQDKDKDVTAQDTSKEAEE